MVFSTKKRNGFTLIEILVVVTIIAVMLAVGAVSYTSVSKKSRDAKRKSDIGQIQQAMEMYRADNLAYPVCTVNGNATCLESVTTPAVFSTYLSQIPSDPKTAAGFSYQIVTTASSYCLSYFSESEATGTLACTPYSSTPITGSLGVVVAKNP